MDCNDGIKILSDNLIDLTITSPPYDNLRKYNGFSFNFEDLAKELYRITKVGGMVVWIVSDATINGSETGTSFKQALFFKEIGFWLYDTMIWLKPSPPSPTEGRYYNVFEYMFILSKGKPKTINLLNDRLNKNPGRKRKKETRQNKEERISLTETRITGQFSRRFNVWEITNNKNTTIHPAIFPEKLVEDHIKSWSNEGDLIFDPFIGSGTVAKVARNNNRNYLGFEISQEYCKIAEQYLN